MKILHVCQNYYPSKGGPQYTLKHLSENLVNYFQDDVTVCTTDSLYNPESALYKKVMPSFEIINNVKVNRLPFRRWHYPVIKYSNKALIKLTGHPLPDSVVNMRWDVYSPAISRLMQAIDADIIMGSTINYGFCNYPEWRNKTANPKPFALYGSVHLHKDSDYNDRIIRKARLCDCYIANTDFEKNELINKYGVSPHKVVTVGTGINTDSFVCNEKDIIAFKKLHHISSTDVVIGFVGRLVKGKGVAVLLEAIRLLHKTNSKLKLLLAGASTDYVPVIKEAIEKEGLPIILIENFEESQKPLIYHAMDIFILPSQSESFGVVFLEAWACKKPVLGSKMGATSSLLNDGADSFLFNLADINTLIEKIRLLLADVALRNRLGENGYNKTIREFSWPAVTHKFRNAYLLGIENFKSSPVTKIERRVNQ